MVLCGECIWPVHGLCYACQMVLCGECIWPVHGLCYACQMVLRGECIWPVHGLCYACQMVLCGECIRPVHGLLCLPNGNVWWMHLTCTMPVSVMLAKWYCHLHSQSIIHKQAVFWSWMLLVLKEVGLKMFFTILPEMFVSFGTLVFCIKRGNQNML